MKVLMLAGQLLFILGYFIMTENRMEWCLFWIVNLCFSALTSYFQYISEKE